MKVPAAKICIPEEDRKAILAKMDEVLETGWLTLGKYGKEFEKEFAEYVHSKYAVTVNSGTTALEMILRSLDVKDSSVIVPTNTFFATPAAVIHAGGRVIFSDVADNLCMSPESVFDNIEKDTKAVIIVHIGGIVPPQIEEIQKICEDNDLFLVEDAAHAHGSTLNGQESGTFGIASSFSFYPTKVITSGEGGMIVTNHDGINERSLILRDQGKAGFYGNVHTELGHNWRMSELHAILGLSQLSRLGEFINCRRRIAEIYDRELERIGGVEPIVIPSNVQSNYYKYIAMLDENLDRQSIKKEMKKQYNVRSKSVV